MPKVEVTNGTVRGDDGQYYTKGQQVELSKERYEQIKAKGDYVKLVRGGGDKTDDGDDNQEQEAAPDEPEPDPAPADPEQWPEEDDRVIDDLPESVHYLNNIKK